MKMFKKSKEACQIRARVNPDGGAHAAFHCCQNRELRHAITTCNPCFFQQTITRILTTLNANSDTDKKAVSEFVLNFGAICVKFWQWSCHDKNEVFFVFSNAS